MAPRDEFVREQNLKWTISVRRDGRRWHASITHGIGYLGESGSTTYASRSPQRTVRKALRTISRLVAERSYPEAHVRIEVEEPWT